MENETTHGPDNGPDETVSRPSGSGTGCVHVHLRLPRRLVVGFSRTLAHRGRLHGFWRTLHYCPYFSVAGFPYPIPHPGSDRGLARLCGLGWIYGVDEPFRTMVGRLRRIA